MDRRDRRRRPAGLGGARDPARRGARRVEGLGVRHGRRDPLGLGAPRARRGAGRRGRRARPRRGAAAPSAGARAAPARGARRGLRRRRAGPSGRRHGQARRGTASSSRRCRATSSSPSRRRRRSSRRRCARGRGGEGSDCASLVEAAGGRVKVVPGDERLLKVTTRGRPRARRGLARRERQVASVVAGIRIGTGVDAHALEEGVPLVLGGVEFDHPRGLAGHSDGDVLAHALIDAVLGAAGLGDIGALFPSGEERFRGISSLALLAEAYAQVREAGWRLVNADCVLVGEEPRIAPHREEMRRRLAGDDRRGRGQRPRDDDRPPRLRRPRRGPRGPGGRAARAAVNLVRLAERPDVRARRNLAEQILAGLRPAASASRRRRMPPARRGRARPEHRDRPPAAPRRPT